jgi:hypothetical protein
MKLLHSLARRPVAISTVLLLGVAALLTSASSTRSEQEEDGEKTVLAALNAYHESLKEGDVERHFALLAPGAVMFGTDPEEQWDPESYRAWLEPFLPVNRETASFPVEQNVSLSDDGCTAWFHERLSKPGFGELRVTGVMRRVDGDWKIAQYHCAFPIPNATAVEAARKLRR